jgi:hypothetical protein
LFRLYNYSPSPLGASPFPMFSSKGSFL